MFGFIYKITNSINDKVYIGQTWMPIKKRFYRHKIDKKGNCPKLFSAFNKHGRDNFQIEPILVCHTQEVLDYWESYFIKKYDSIKNGYNIKKGGRGAKGFKHSKNTKRKMSQSQKDWLAKNNHPWIGRKHSEETKKKLSEIERTPEWYAKVSKSKTGSLAWNKGVSILSKKEILVVAKYKELQSCKKVGDFFGVSADCVHRFLKDKNVLKPAKSRSWVTSKEEVLKMYKEIGAEKTSKHFNVSKKTIYQFIKENS